MRDPTEPVVVRLYRLLLRLYPPALRRAHGDEMVEMVRRRWAEIARARRGPGRVAFLVRTLAGACVQAAAAWGERAVRRPLPDLRDLRAGGATTLRSLVRDPAFTAAAVVTLALGIGANTAIFSVVETVLLDPLPYPGSDRLVVTDPYPWTPTEIVFDLERSSGSIEAVTGFYPRPFTITGDGEPVQIEGARVAPGFFPFLGARMALGRDFTAEDARPGAPGTAVVSHAYWQSRWGGSREVVGGTIQLDGEPHEIVGVAERRFRQIAPRSDDPHIWVAHRFRGTEADGSFRWMIPLIRLRPGVSPDRVQADLDAVLAGFLERYPNDEARGAARRNARLASVKSTLVGDVRPALLLLQLAVGILLLLACVNVANLLLVRTSGRQGELAIRSALGASRGALLRHLLGESFVLAILGGAGALLLVLPGLDALIALLPRDMPRIDQVSVDGSVLLFTLAASLATGLLFGAAPAAAALRGSLSNLLQTDGRTAAGSRRKHRLSRALVVAQVTLTLVLLVGAGLLVRSFLSLTAREPGFRTEDIVAVSVHVSPNRYADVPALEEFYRRARERIARVPGIESVDVANRVPMQRGGSTREYLLEGEEAGAERPANYAVVSPGYFRTLEIPLLRGRTFAEADHRGREWVAVVDRAFAREAWPGADPIGRRFRFGSPDGPWRTVVGVVENTLGSGLAREPEPGFYIPYRQRPDTPVELAVGRRRTVFLARSGLSPERIADPLRRAVWDVDPYQPVPEIRTLNEIISETVAPERLRAVLLGSFAAVALLLVVAGIYGVVAYLVTERTRELGIRVAMGATDGDIVRSVLGWGLRLYGLGVAAGLVAVVAGTRFLESLLFGVAHSDPWTVAGSAVLVLGVTLVACALPARRAVRMDPVEALRSEGRRMGALG